MAEFSVDHFKHASDVLRYFSVLKSQNAHTVFGEEGTTIAVGCNFVCITVGASVDLYCEASLEAEEIEHKASEWNLSFELPTVNLSVAKLHPNDFFRVRL